MLLALFGRINQMQCGGGGLRPHWPSLAYCIMKPCAQHAQLRGEIETAQLQEEKKLEAAVVISSKAEPKRSEHKEQRAQQSRGRTSLRSE